MSRDDFIISVYCLVCESYEKMTRDHPVRQHGGFAPKLTDQEVITMEICGEYFQFQTDKGIFGYFQYHYRHFFPQLTQQTLFLRCCFLTTSVFLTLSLYYFFIPSGNCC